MFVVVGGGEFTSRPRSHQPMYALQCCSSWPEYCFCKCRGMPEDTICIMLPRTMSCGLLVDRHPSHYLLDTHSVTNQLSSSTSAPELLAVALILMLWLLALVAPLPATGLLLVAVFDGPASSMPCMASPSSSFSSILTSSPAQIRAVGCQIMTILSSDVVAAVHCSPTPGAQQKSDGRAV